MCGCADEGIGRRRSEVREWFDGEFNLSDSRTLVTFGFKFQSNQSSIMEPGSESYPVFYSKSYNSTAISSAPNLCKAVSIFFACKGRGRRNPVA